MKEKDLLKIIEFYKENKKVVHITCYSGWFYNGQISEIKKNGFIILDERKLGKVILPLNDVERVEPIKKGMIK